MGTWRLVRLALRRDRITIPVTLGLTVAMVAGSAPALASAYPDYQARLEYVISSVPSIVGRFFQGTIQGVSLGSILIAETFLSAVVIVAVMSIFIVSRHTRYNEEIGAGELIGSMEVGRNAPLSAALIVAVVANLIVAVVIFLFLARVPALSRTGSIFFVSSLAMSGIFFSGLTAVTVQLSDYRRGANALAIGALVTFFMIRAVGDSLGKVSLGGLRVTASWVSWLSPLGWASQTLPYYANRLLPLVLLFIGFLLTTLMGFFILSKRDVGSSIFPSKPGPARAKSSLTSAGGLARRLQRNSFYGWLAGFVLTGLMVGVMVTDFRNLFEQNAVWKQLLGNSGATENFTASVLGVMFPRMAAMLAGYVVSALIKMYDEEGYGRIEFLITTALSKTKWFFSHVTTIVIGITMSLAAMGLAGGLGYLARASVKEVSLLNVVLSSLANVPAMMLFMAIILIVFAIRGRFVKTFAWSFYAYVVLIDSLVRIFKWPDWLSKLSPFSHTPAVPSSNVDIWPLIFMTIIAIVLFFLAADLFRRRDLNLS